MNKLVLDYYERRFAGDISNAFVHLVREIGEVALAIEKVNSEHAKLKITEASALLQYLAWKYGFDLDVNIQQLYSKKLDSLTRIGHK
jgi:hypothetical protein